MSAGKTLLANIWDYTYTNDEVAGAVPSGTVLYERVEMRIHSITPTQALLEQGIEDISMFKGIIMNHTIEVENNNEIEVTHPWNTPYVNERFRVVGNPQRTSMGASDSRSYLVVMLRRIEKSRTIQ